MEKQINIKKNISIPTSSTSLASLPAFLLPFATDTATPRALALYLPTSLSVYDVWVGYRRRRPTPGGEAFAYLFAGDERPPGIPTPFLFPVCCAKPSSRTLTSSYLAIWCLLTSSFLQKLLDVHVYTQWYLRLNRLFWKKCDCSGLSNANNWITVKN